MTMFATLNPIVSEHQIVGDELVKRIGKSEKDYASLERLLRDRTFVESAQPRDYRNKVVLKPWGYEFLIFENECVAIWFLHIRKGHSTSMHCHPGKKTSLILLSGKALCNTFEHRNFLNGIEAVIIEAGVFHSTQSLSLEGINLIEIETPPNKTDLVRMNDGYGRESSGYEGHSQMQTEDLGRFGFFSFDEVHEAANPFMAQGYNVAMQTLADDAALAHFLAHNQQSYSCICKGALSDKAGNILLSTGDTDSTAGMADKGIHRLASDAPVTLLTAWRSER